LSMYARDVIKSELYQACFPRIKIRSDKDTLSHFINTDGGERYAVGSGGSATGLIHAHALGLDDVINPEQALSEAEMASINHWMVHTLLNRKVDKEVSFVHVVGQRLAQGDPYDEFLRVSPRVKHFVIPADLDYEVKPPELKEFYVDGLMDPVRLSKESLEEEKKKGDHYYAGQFGQNPVPAGGGTFKTALIRWGRPPGVYKKVVRFWDRAGTSEMEAKRRTSYTAGVKMAEDTEGRFWVLDVVRGRWDSWSRERMIRRTAIRDRRITIVGQEQEPGSGGKDQVRGSARRLRGFRVVTLVSRGKKETRAEEFSVQVNAGNVWLPEQFRQGNDWTGWAKEYIEELRYWPFAAWKDQGDASAGAFSILARGNVSLGPIPDDPNAPVDAVALGG
jgi:predicted phage terminase large subunit-like protein